MCYSIDVANATIMRTVADSEENRTDEDREYREEYGDDYTKGATSTQSRSTYYAWLK